MDGGCALRGCREAAAGRSRFCRGHLVTRAVKARQTWTRAAKLLGPVGLALLLVLPRPSKAWGAIPGALAPAPTAMALRPGQVISGRTQAT